MGVPTLRDVAEACGVSPATVSKALNPHADRCDISPATRAKVAAAARALGFSPSASHRQRTRRLWRNIGVVWGRFAPFTSGVYEGVLDAVGERLVERGWRLFYTPVTEPEAWREMQMAQRLDGVLAISHVPPPVLASFAADRYPAVLLNLRTELPLPQYLPDDRAGAEALARHLAGLGHRKAIYLTDRQGGVGHFSESDRPAGLDAGGAAAGLRFERLPPEDLAGVVARCRAGATAVVCYDWGDAPVVLRALAAAGLSVPRDVSVAACTDVSWFQYLQPDLTAIGIPMKRMALEALDNLLHVVDAGTVPKAAPRVAPFPVELRIRGSTGPARA